MALQKLAENDVLGNSAAHFFKSGNIVRGSEIDGLAELKDLLPTKGPNGTNVEYDIWYDMADQERIHGYMYTDAMAKFLYIRAAGAYWTHKIMQQASKEPITEEGERIFQDLAENSVDKYKLRKARSQHDFVIFLPGTNIIKEALDWDKMENAIKQGAKLKCHPITAPGLVANLKHRYGKENILDKKLSGHELMAGASIVGCCENSEMGIVSLAQGKKTYLFGHGHKHLTYSALYNTIWKGGKADVNKLKSILSAKYSGMIPVIAESPQEYINSYFNHYKEMPHVKPRNNNP
jgi:hypothetical protein|tara:strand:- start:2559 stop:3434 length:876 start_codon:yes stop_codon:yes gene_type:complete